MQHKYNISGWMMSDNFWSSKHTWRVSANNTKWCLIGCAIGDFGTIAVMQDSGVSVIIIFALAMLNGIIVSILRNIHIDASIDQICECY